MMPRTSTRMAATHKDMRDYPRLDTEEFTRIQDDDLHRRLQLLQQAATALDGSREAGRRLLRIRIREFLASLGMCRLRKPSAF